MANPELLKILKQGTRVWNAWRQQNENVIPDFRDADLRRFPVRPYLEGGVYNGISLKDAVFDKANLSGLNFDGANLIGASFSEADLSDAKLTHALMVNTNFSFANLSNVDFSQSIWARVILGDSDLTGAKGLTATEHFASSIIDFQTLEKSKDIPPDFLRVCGMSEGMIGYLSAIATPEPIQFNSCFVSYSHKDEPFVKRLYSRMREANVRVWYAPEDVKGGQKLHDQIDQAIQIHDRLLLVLSKNSLNSEWVMTEIRKARKNEIRENRRKLFPIRLVDFDVLQEWECFDADQGKDLAVEIREYFVPDFSDWKNHDAFESAFGRLLKDLALEGKH